MKPEADIVIVNWNSGDLLRECIQSTRDYSGGVGKVVVVDNGSSDGSEELGPLGKGVELVLAGRNLGFAAACNRGARGCDARYILFLNPDARLLPDGLTKALSFMESEVGQEVGVCGVRLIGDGEEVQRHCTAFPSLRTYLGQATGLSRVMPRAFPSPFMLSFDHLTSRPVDVVIGAYYLVRRDLFAELGGFDERFFVYFDEVDFSLRARKKGWRTFYFAPATAYHKGNALSDQVKAHRLFYSVRSRIFYAFKNFGPASAIGSLAVLCLLEPFGRFGRAVLRASWEELADTARGYGMLFADLPRILSTAARLPKNDVAQHRSAAQPRHRGLPGQ